MTISGTAPSYKGGEHSVITEVVSTRTTASLALAALSAKSGEFNYIDALIVSFETPADSELCQVVQDTSDTRTIMFEFFAHGTNGLALLFPKPIRQPTAGLNVGLEVAAVPLDGEVAVIMGHTGT